MSESVKLYGLWRDDLGWYLDVGGAVVCSSHSGVLKGQRLTMIMKDWHGADRWQVRQIGARGKPLARKKSGDEREACESE